MLLILSFVLIMASNLSFNFTYFDFEQAEHLDRLKSFSSYFETLIYWKYGTATLPREILARQVRRANVSSLNFGVVKVGFKRIDSFHYCELNISFLIAFLPSDLFNGSIDYFLTWCFLFLNFCGNLVDYRSVAIGQ